MIGKLPILVRNAGDALKRKTRTLLRLTAGPLSNTEVKPRQTDVCQGRKPSEQYVSGDRDVTF